jgi:hypothetical protein
MDIASLLVLLLLLMLLLTLTLSWVLTNKLHPDRHMLGLMWSLLCPFLDWTSLQ